MIFQEKKKKSRNLEREKTLEACQNKNGINSFKNELFVS